MIAALVLAGGRGTRLGGVDKAFVQLHGRPLIEHVLERLLPQVGSRIAISANRDPGRFAAYPFPVLADAPADAGRGPLAGIAAGLGWAGRIGADAMLSVPVDTPLFPADLVHRLAPGPAVACHGGRQHHLAALWPTGFRAALAGFLDASASRRVRDALELCGARRIDFAGDVDPFANINTPDDLAEIARRF